MLGTIECGTDRYLEEYPSGIIIGCCPILPLASYEWSRRGRAVATAEANHQFNPHPILILGYCGMAVGCSRALINTRQLLPLLLLWLTQPQTHSTGNLAHLLHPLNPAHAHPCPRDWTMLSVLFAAVAGVLVGLVWLAGCSLSLTWYGYSVPYSMYSGSGSQCIRWKSNGRWGGRED